MKQSDLGYELDVAVQYDFNLENSVLDCVVNSHTSFQVVCLTCPTESVLRT